jgi:hypothetical protein
MLSGSAMDATLDRALKLLRDDRPDESHFVLSLLVEERPNLEPARELLALLERNEGRRSPTLPRPACPAFNDQELAWFDADPWPTSAEPPGPSAPARWRGWAWLAVLAAVLGVQTLVTVVWSANR